MHYTCIDIVFLLPVFFNLVECYLSLAHQTNRILAVSYDSRAFYPPTGASPPGRGRVLCPLGLRGRGRSGGGHGAGRQQRGQQQTAPTDLEYGHRQPFGLECV